MQPWLNRDARETGCRRCGRAFHDGDVHIWACRERTRRLEFGDARPSAGLIRYDEVSRAYPVCGACLQALERGAGMGGAALGRLLLLMGALAVLWLVAGPLVHRWTPNFTAAFYRNGAVGR